MAANSPAQKINIHFMISLFVIATSFVVAKTSLKSFSPSFTCFGVIASAFADSKYSKIDSASFSPNVFLKIS